MVEPYRGGQKRKDGEMKRREDAGVGEPEADRSRHLSTERGKDASFCLLLIIKTKVSHFFVIECIFFDFRFSPKTIKQAPKCFF